MKVAIRKSLTLTAVILGLSVGSAHAQEVAVKVPFAFVVRGETLPAGDYVVQRVDQDPAVLMIRGVNARAFTIVLTSPADGRDPAGDKPTLTFTREENQYRLDTVWESGTEGRTVAKS